MTVVSQHLRSSARYASPRYWKWRRLLQSLTLDPDALPRPVAAPGPRDVIICGSPRSGTSLAAAVVHRPPRSVAVMEPWDGMRLPPAELFSSLREEIGTTGSLRRGRLDAEALGGLGEVQWKREGLRTERTPTLPRYLLAVKWPAYWRYLDMLEQTRFIVCLRHPLEVIASYRRTGARLESGYDYEVPFNRRMNDYLSAATQDKSERRVRLYEYIYSRIAPHLSRPTVYSLRYERWRSEPAEVLNELSEFLETDVRDTPVQIRTPEPPDVSAEERALIRAFCKSANAIGYAV